MSTQKQPDRSLTFAVVRTEVFIDLEEKLVFKIKDAVQAGLFNERIYQGLKLLGYSDEIVCFYASTDYTAVGNSFFCSEGPSFDIVFSQAYQNSLTNPNCEIRILRVLANSSFPPPRRDFYI